MGSSPSIAASELCCTEGNYYLLVCRTGIAGDPFRSPLSVAHKIIVNPALSIWVMDARAGSLAAVLRDPARDPPFFDP